MKQQLENIKAQAIEMVANAQDRAELDAARVKFLGKKLLHYLVVYDRMLRVNAMKKRVCIPIHSERAVIS